MELPKDHYRKKAAQARALARAASPLFRADLLQVAAQWDMLADECDVTHAEPAVPPNTGQAA